MPPANEEKDAVALEVPSDDPKKKSEKGDKKDEEVKEEEELSEEDRLLKEGLELSVERVQDQDVGVIKMALDHLRNEIRQSTSSMTSVPKPLKFLRPHFDTLKTVYESMKKKDSQVEDDIEVKKSLADIVSVLAMTMGKPGDRESLNYKLEGHRTDLGPWGHEFLRSLAGEIGEEYSSRQEAAAADAEVDVSDLMELVDEIVPYHVQHNAEAEAVDLLVEVQQLHKLRPAAGQGQGEEGTGKLASVVDKDNHARLCLYLLRLSSFMPEPEDLQEMLLTAFELYRTHDKFTDALRVAIKMDDRDKVIALFSECTDVLVKKQMAYILARHGYSVELMEDEEITNIIGNNQVSELYLKLAKELDVMEAKTPEDIYKSHLAETAGFTRRRDQNGAQVDSARANLASTFVNAFVNAGFGQDTLMTTEGSSWLYKNKDHGMLSAAASLGMILLWNVEEGLTQIDKFMYSSDDYIKAGAALAVGVVSATVRNESDPALALLADHVKEGSHNLKVCSCIGLGLAYAGSWREDVMEELLPVVANTESNASMTEVSLAALSLGLIFVGSCNEEVGSTLVQRLMESSDAELDQTVSRFLALGLGLLFLGKTEKAEAMLEAVRTVTHPKMAKYSEITLETCAYAASGNVLKVQELLHLCAEHLEEESAGHQAVAVLGISLVALGENIGSEMALRTFDHLLHYGELPIKRAVPLSLALLHVSDPDFSVIDQLSRLTHDQDPQVAQCAIIGLGVVGAGTNNSRIAGLLRQLSEFYAREAHHLFTVRIAQGFLHMGKGLLTLHPFHSDRTLMSGPSIGAILILMHCCFDLKNTILDKMHYLLYYVTCAMRPRMLMCLLSQEEEGKEAGGAAAGGGEDCPAPEGVAAPVRVGQAVETVGQAGRPKTITGFQTHTTPVLLGVSDRAELAGSEYVALSTVLEDVVILRKNPDAEEENT
uniref:26S proteasome non-ATPase regulatory subunit 2 homolog n=1 Tax=Fibrocapsa japonica TaxID=94617 RepID=A0A7S2V4A2_9STRA|mmetsp:Transcript_24206/g.35197  ORF Transcript_24206/g.35197 Transcript_24206/m.35197 type:complete len:940 (+) Transcript_24206:68-2887(+)